MSDAELTRFIDPDKASLQEATLEGGVPVRALERFAQSLVDADGVAQVRIRFFQDSERRRVAEGHIDVSVKVECQRCLNGFPVTLESDYRLGLVSSDEQAKQLPRELEPFQYGDEGVDLWQLVEDELLLVLPPFPSHEENECPATELLAQYHADETESADDESEGEGAREDNPFSVLEVLKRGDGN